MKTTSGLNILRPAGSHGFLVVNGEQVGEELADCLQTAVRRAYQVGAPVPPNLVDRLKADPNVLPAGFTMPKFLSVFVVGPDGESTRSGSWVGKGEEAFWEEMR